ncbi:MAG TPA: 4Fe-4S binding protein [Terriglobales bacterium]|nr:4Fe-4S binding protein [Terriglobales bacterium]
MAAWGSAVSHLVQDLDENMKRGSVSLASPTVRQWKPTITGRTPIFPQQSLKLRDATPVVNEERCKGCSYCIEFCPRKVLELSKHLNNIGIHPPRVRDETLCVGCGVCEEICPDFAIFLVDKKNVGED